MDEGVVLDFVQAGRRQVILHAVLDRLHGVFAAFLHGQHRIMGFNLVVGMHAGDFFGNIRVAGHVAAPGRHGDLQVPVLLFFHFEFQAP